MYFSTTKSENSCLSLDLILNSSYMVERNLIIYRIKKKRVWFIFLNLFSINGRAKSRSNCSLYSSPENKNKPLRKEPPNQKKKKYLIIQNFSSPNSNQFNLSTITTTTSLNSKILNQLWILNR